MAEGQLAFRNLSSVFNVSEGICFNCAVDIVLLVHTELVNEVGLRNSLVNAIGRYTILTVTVRLHIIFL